jgi:phenylacetate-CoA ligase
VTLKEQELGMLTVPESALFKMSSSGSTGRPVTVYRSEREQAEVSALHARIHAAFGRRPLDRQVSIDSGKAAAAKGPVALLRRTGLLPAMHRLSRFDTLASQVEVLRRIRPHVLSGYSVAIEQLAEAVIAAGGLAATPRLVYTGSMATSERCRRLVEQAFGVRPLDVYATMETGPLAWECPECPGDYHLNDDVQLIEIVDDEGRRVPDGATATRLPMRPRPRAAGTGRRPLDRDRPHARRSGAQHGAPGVVLLEAAGDPPVAGASDRTRRPADSTGCVPGVE